MVAQRLEHGTVSREDQGSSPPVGISKFGQFRLPHFAGWLDPEMGIVFA